MDAIGVWNAWNSSGILLTCGRTSCTQHAVVLCTRQKLLSFLICFCIWSHGLLEKKKWIGTTKRWFWQGFGSAVRVDKHVCDSYVFVCSVVYLFDNIPALVLPNRRHHKIVYHMHSKFGRIDTRARHQRVGVKPCQVSWTPNSKMVNDWTLKISEPGQIGKGKHKTHSVESEWGGKTVCLSTHTLVP